MTLAPGLRLGPYEVLGPLGVGGMGEVYRARDTRLGRDVAIKVLPAEVAADAERLARFRREAHLLAALNHSNIAAIYGLEESDGKPFLVLELVEGDTLQERIARGRFQLDEALPIARQVAEALEEAHEHGIVHRDRHGIDRNMERRRGRGPSRASLMDGGAPTSGHVGHRRLRRCRGRRGCLKPTLPNPVA